MPFLNNEETIAAIATPVGEGGIAVIRISGSQAVKTLSQIFQCGMSGSSFESHRVYLGKIVDEKQAVIDQALMILFKAPNSYTGEDVVEIHSHGGFVVTQSVLRVILNLGIRHAEPGEFTRRAFLNGKMDLTQAEAVLDLIHAKSRRSADVAARQLEGMLSKKLKSLKDELMKIYAHFEAYLDFPEEDLDVYEDKKQLEGLREMKKIFQNFVRGFDRTARLREGAVIAIVGKPNVGKSSLFNTLLEKDRALVSEYPGTTRDQLEESIELNGLWVRLIDTAGLSSTPQNPLDQMGIERTLRSMAQAHFFLWVLDGSAPLDDEDQKILKKLQLHKNILIVVNKSDLEMKLEKEMISQLLPGKDCLFLSAQTLEGFEVFEKKLEEWILGDLCEWEGEQITRLRHRYCLEISAIAMERAESALKKHESLEFVVFEIKNALHSVQELIGEVYSEDLLDVIFSEFCIGK